MRTVALRPVSLRSDTAEPPEAALKMKSVAPSFESSLTRTNESVPYPVELIEMRSAAEAWTAETPSASLKLLIAARMLVCEVPEAKVNCCTPFVPVISKVTSPEPPLPKVAPVERNTAPVWADCSTVTVTERAEPSSDSLAALTVTSVRLADWPLTV